MQEVLLYQKIINARSPKIEGCTVLTLSNVPFQPPRHHVAFPAAATHVWIVVSVLTDNVTLHM